MEKRRLNKDDIGKRFTDTEFWTNRKTFVPTSFSPNEDYAVGTVSVEYDDERVVKEDYVIANILIPWEEVCS